MNPAIIAAVKVCILVATPHWYQVTAQTVSVENIYPVGYERCPDLIAEQNREEAAERIPGQTAEESARRNAYARGLRALGEGNLK